MPLSLGTNFSYIYAMTTIACLFVFLVCAWAQTPKAPLWPTVPNPSANFLFTIQSFYAPNTITAFDVNSTAHIHKSIMYYYYDNGVKGERHDHFGYCYGWGNEDCTILIIGKYVKFCFWDFSAFYFWACVDKLSKLFPCSDLLLVLIIVIQFN